MNFTESELQTCFMCGDECESKEKEAEMVRCPCCLREEAKMDKTPEWMIRDLINGRIA